MSSKTLIKTSHAQAVEESNKIFQATDTYLGSVAYMKQMTIVAVSTMTYCEGAFGDYTEGIMDESTENYKKERIGGLELEILRKDCKNEMARFLISALDQAFDALDKKYRLSVSFFSEVGEEGLGGEGVERGDLLSCMVLEYTYGPRPSLRLRSGDHLPAPTHAHAPAPAHAHAPAPASATAHEFTFDALRTETMQLLRACLATMGTVPLPPRFDIIVQASYTKDAPEGYQAPGYVPCPDILPSRDSLFGPHSGSLSLGSVRTQHHALRLHYLCPKMSFPPDTPAAAAVAATSQRSLSPRSPTQVSAALSTTAGEVLESEGSMEDSGPSVPTGGATGRTNGGTTGGTTGRTTGGSQQQAEVHCVCRQSDRETPLLVCGVCDRVQHAACYGLQESRARHTCVQCYSNSVAGTGRDMPPALAELAGALGPSLAMFRRALLLLRRRSARTVSAALVGARLSLSARSTHKLMVLLHSKGLLHTPPPYESTEEVLFVREQVDKVMSDYFQDEIIDLTPESPSADQSDAQTDRQDALREYREALTSSQERLVDQSGLKLDQGLPKTKASKRQAAAAGVKTKKRRY